MPTFFGKLLRVASPPIWKLLLGMMVGWMGSPQAWADVLVRAEIASTTGSVRIGSSTAAEITDTTGKKYSDLPAMKAIWATPQRQGIVLNGLVAPVLRIKPTGDGLVAVNNRWYAGEVILMGRNQILAVNYVNIEDYVASVVEAEMGSSFSPEALKAQAIAARSYVLYHRNSRPWFDVHSDTRSQVYRGVNHSPAVLAATEATKGIVMVYGGEFVNAMYSSSSGGQTVGVQGIPYLRSVPDITNRPKFGHGIGMSQWGAEARARQDWNYRQILGYYYRGVSLGRLPE
ncbi:MAG: SpoIID/LytB domain-containing protein [Cyanobacteriota bacterium]|nr:SpoIID/LytB domain-containing protein [Cyanobacteriota bacterium]